MLGLVLLYFIGKSFYTLANTYNRSPWGFAILGVVAYYGANFAFQLLLIFILEVDLDPYLIAVISIPFGLLAWWGLYTYLKKQWEINPVRKSSDVLDDGMFLED